MTNVPGNLLRRNLPVGMGVCFETPRADAAASLELYAQSRMRALAL